ncbi:ABC-2 type transport system ATP-binding protein [Paenibacillus endophyticus]|uniref:ABC-2 type transport system ATP-binding protein n=1 Tax=Paenibacillus endophyticus TaxID=1294268 RepID=A0A7W5GBY6_9BACL|nr:ATP-binding cassette domain-containing protein [Paenibacillus endophyticus]MBB3154794.1 ABC-2 type transport system ATP-binding protein [Paenibacillus endophyticus]
MAVTSAIKETAPVLSLQQVTKRIGGKTIVDRMSFTIQKGEIVGLLGPNGAGKTTTIRMLVGLIQMSEGDVFVQGHSIRNDFSNAIRHIGAIIENPEFYPYMSGWDNLKQYQRMDSGITDERIKIVTELVGLEAAMNKKVKAYSLGMRQRLGIAQALLGNPSLLILDEPTNGLDPAGIREMRQYLQHIADHEGISILVSSHLLSEMELMCSRVVVIQEGKYVTERDLHQGKEQSQLLTVKIRVDQLDSAYKISSAIHGVEVAGLDKERNEIVLSLQDELIPQVVAKLGEGKIKIYRITETKLSLEEEFLKWTGGSRIA